MTCRQVTYGIGLLSKRTGVNVETIRYYERRGIVPTPPRTASGHRRYDETYARRLRFVSRSRKLGFPLEEIRSLLALIEDREYSCADVKRLALHHAAQATRQISELRALERTLKRMAAECHGDHVADCAIVDALLR